MVSIRYILVISFLIADPSDVYDDFYFGGWPVNSNKDDIVGANLTPDCEKSQKESLCECSSDQDCISGKCFSSPRVGKYCLQGDGTVFPRLILQDQFREEVDLYDFAGQGKLIIIDLSTSWCQPCRDLSDWLANDDLSITENRNWKKEYNIIKDLVLNNEIYFINIMLQDSYRDPASVETLEDWYQRYPSENIPVLADADGTILNWLRPTGYPTVILLNDKMEVVQFSIRGWHEAFNYISKLDWKNKSKL
tara:strand:- start:414 stop:1163 length:750 start_codon:yes stop_codon:yes gene_type:complete